MQSSETCWFSVLSRIFVIFLAVLFVFKYLQFVVARVSWFVKVALIGYRMETQCKWYVCMCTKLLDGLEQPITRIIRLKLDILWFGCWRLVVIAVELRFYVFVVLIFTFPPFHRLFSWYFRWTHFLRCDSTEFSVLFQLGVSFKLYIFGFKEIRIFEDLHYWRAEMRIAMVQ